MGEAFWVNPGQELKLECEVVNQSNTTVLATHTAADSVLGQFTLPPNLVIGHEAVYRHATEFRAPADSVGYSDTTTWSAWSSDGILHTRSFDYDVQVRDVDVELSLITPALEVAQPGEWIPITVHAVAGDEFFHTPLARWTVEDELTGGVGSGEGSPGPDGIGAAVSYNILAPPVADTYDCRVVLTGWDVFGQSARSEIEYTIIVPGTDFDPDGDGMLNAYEVKNGLNPLVHDSLIDSDHRFGRPGYHRSAVAKRSRKHLLPRTGCRLANLKRGPDDQCHLE